jgi:glucose/arabinose dehydrogenase
VTLVPLNLKVTAPIDVTHRPDSSSLLVAERAGVIQEAVKQGDGYQVAPRPVLDIDDLAGEPVGEQGLLGIAVSTDGNWLYVSYTDNNGDSHIDSYPLSGQDGSLAADKAGRRELFFAEQPYPNHNGGSLVVGPDRMLYAGFGDGGDGGDPQGRAQNPDTPLGKILRFDPEGVNDHNQDGTPDDNPFVSGGGDPHVWSTGLRNPWRISFDEQTGDLWVGTSVRTRSKRSTC